MAIRVKHRVWVNVAEDTLMKNKLFSPDAELSEVISDGFEKTTSGRISIAASGNENLNLGDITAVKGLWLKVDGAAKIKINGSSDEIQLRLEPDGVAGTDFAKFFIEADISSLNVANDSAVVMNGVWCVWGDPTP
jgi:hypothetical protein